MADMNVIIPGSVEFFLIKEGKVTEDQVREAQLIAQDSKNEVTSELVNLGYCSELDVARAMEKKTGYKLVSIEEVGINFAIANIIPPELIAKRKILPLYQDEKKLFVVMHNPNDLGVRDNLSVRTGGLEIVPLISTESELNAAIDTIVNNANNIDTYEDEEAAQEEELSALDELAADEKPAVQLVNQVITNAVRSGASDIHFEPMEKTLRVRLRIDGVLHEIMTQPVKLHASVASRVKVIGGMDIAEKLSLIHI